MLGRRMPFSSSSQLRTCLALGVSALTVLAASSIWQPTTAKAAPGINENISFQGKVANADGSNVTDGAYDFVFKMYDGASSSSTALFTESWVSGSLFTSTMSSAPDSGGELVTYSSNANESTLRVGQILWNTTKKESVKITSVNTSTNTLTISATRQAWSTSDTITNRIYVKDGLFTVAINSLNNDLSGVNFNSDSIFLGVNFNGDGEMKPRIQFTSVPYAFSSKTVNGVTVTNTSGNTAATGTAIKIGDNKTLQFNNSLIFAGTDGKTLTVNNTLTFGGTDSATVNFGNGGTVCYTTSCLTSIANDSLDFDKFKDAMSLDAATSIALGSNNFTFSGTGGVKFNNTGDTTFAGKVGIGGTPTDQLHIISTSSNRITVENNVTNGYAGARFKTGSGEWFVGVNGGNTLQFVDNAAGSTRMMINEYGNLGINVTGGYLDALTVSATDADRWAGQFYYNFGSALQSVGVIALNRYDNTEGNEAGIDFFLQDSTGATQGYAYVGASIEDNTNGTEDGALIFGTAVNGSSLRSEQMRLNGIGLAIGDSTPVAKFEIAGTNNAMSDVGTSANYLQVLRYKNSTSGAGAGLAFAVTNADNNVGASLVFRQTGSNSQGELRFYNKQSTTSGADPTLAMVINDNGRVAIGGSTADSALHVISTTGSADMITMETNSSAEAGISIKNTSAQYNMSTTFGLFVLTHANSTSTVLSADGANKRVAIGGVLVPTATLDVDGVIRVRNPQGETAAPTRSNNGDFAFAHAGGARRLYARINGQNVYFNSDGSGDYSEYFAKAEAAEDLPPGTVVTMDSGTVTKANFASQTFGIISAFGTRNNDDNEDGMRSEDPKFANVALMGQVPVFVTAENGPILPGSPLTVSQLIPGFAAKSLANGSFARSLETFAATNCTPVPSVKDIIMPPEVRNQNSAKGMCWKLPNGREIGRVMTYFIASTGQLATTSAESQLAHALTPLANALTIGADTLNSSLALTVNGKITAAHGLTVDGPAAFNGPAIFRAVAQFLDTVIFHKPVTFANHVEYSRDAAGTVVIAAGQTTAQITFDNPYSSQPTVGLSRVLPDFTDREYDQLKETDKCLNLDKKACREEWEKIQLVVNPTPVVTERSENGFTVTISKPVNLDLHYSWSVIAVATKSDD